MNAQELTLSFKDLEGQLKILTSNVRWVQRDSKATIRALNDLRQEVDRTIPLLKEAVDDLKRWKEEEDRDREAYLHLKRDVEEFKKWKADQKQEKDELSRRMWSFGPNLVAAIVAVVLTILGNILIAYFKK